MFQLAELYSLRISAEMEKNFILIASSLKKHFKDVSRMSPLRSTVLLLFTLRLNHSIDKSVAKCLSSMVNTKFTRLLSSPLASFHFSENHFADWKQLVIQIAEIQKACIIEHFPQQRS